jgi:4'-phosphopantetheinyl transferase EntD
MTMLGSREEAMANWALIEATILAPARAESGARHHARRSGALTDHATCGRLVAGIDGDLRNPIEPPDVSGSLKNTVI